MGMEFNWGYGTAPEGLISHPLPDGNPAPLQAQGNLNYLQFIDLLNQYVEAAHPEWQFTPFADNNIYNPEMGYLVYSLVDRQTKENNTKPRIHYVEDHPLYSDRKIIVFIQSFTNTVKFTAVHQNPRVAEAMIEEFQNFMYTAILYMKQDGLEECIFGRRAADEHKTRYGEDLPARSIIYLVTTQTVLLQDIDKLNQIYIDITAPRVDNMPEQATPNTADVFVTFHDTHATPSTSL